MRNIILSLMVVCGSHFLYAQGVGINTLKPDPSAALDIVSDNRGLLIPRVDLKTLTDGKTINKPAHSLLIYNLNGKLPGGEGYYFNAGTKDNPEWIEMADAIDAKASKIAFRAEGFIPGQLVVWQSSQKVLFATESYDLSGNYDDSPLGSGSVFTAPLKGIYHFELVVSRYPILGSWQQLKLIKIHNGTESIVAEDKLGGQFLSSDISLDPADQVKVVFANTFPNDEPESDVTLNDQYAHSFFTGRLVIRQ